MKNKSTQIIIAFIIVWVIFVLVLIFPKKETKSDFSTTDIVDMNIGAEMPQLLYADDEEIVLFGTCGVIVYSAHEEKILTRISFGDFRKMNIDSPTCKVSADGKTLYILENNTSRYKYIISSDTLQSCTKIKEDLFYVETVYLPSDERLKDYVDYSFLLGENIVETNKHLIYLRANSDWSMKSLQIVFHNIGTHEIKAYNVFD